MTTRHSDGVPVRGLHIEHRAPSLDEGNGCLSDTDSPAFVQGVHTGSQSPFPPFGHGQGRAGHGVGYDGFCLDAPVVLDQCAAHRRAVFGLCHLPRRRGLLRLFCPELRGVDVGLV